MIELTPEETIGSRYQFGTLKRGENIKYAPFAFTEEGVAMLSSVLHSQRAVSVNVEIMRAFVRLRHLIESNTELAKKIDDLEKKYDHRFAVVFQAIKQLMERPVQAQEPPEVPRRKIGY